MRDLNELNSHPPAARHHQTGGGTSTDHFPDAEVPHTFDRSLSTLMRQLDAMTAAGWPTGTPAGSTPNTTGASIETGPSGGLQ
ncbi:hypothetical protein [Nocardia sp. GTS18]|uniref:hypothetical protein n=1 Tax=Nocardia sp. GTS18 TaxID=1778064 RepID=UPI0015EF32C1|nr:hypothetical protein [Nocardia sp. GTS18]